MKIDLNMYEINRTVTLINTYYQRMKGQYTEYWSKNVAYQKGRTQKAENINGRIECANNSELNICYVFSRTIF